MTPTVLVGWDIGLPASEEKYRRHCQSGERHGYNCQHILSRGAGNIENVRDDVAAQADDNSRQPHHQQPECPEGLHGQLARTL